MAPCVRLVHLPPLVVLTMPTLAPMTEAEEAVITSAVRFYAAFGARSEETAQKALIQAVKELLASEPNQKEDTK